MDRKLEKDRIDEIIGNNIRLERTARRLTRDELANMLEITASHLGLIERGERGATAVTLSMLSNAFGIPIDHLFNSPVSDGQTVFSDVDETNRKKILSLLTCLNHHELDFVTHVIKGMIAMGFAQGAEEQ